MELTKNEQDLITFWRCISSGLLEISVVHAAPTEGRIHYDDFLHTQQPSNYPISEVEQSVIETIRFMQFGKLFVQITSGVPIRIEPHSYRTVRFGVDSKAKKMV